MSYNMRTRSKYDLLINPNVSKFKKKKILLIGAGAIGQQYAFALHKMKIHQCISFEKVYFFICFIDE